MRGMKEERKLFPGSNLPYSPIADKSKFLSLSPPFCCFCWEICPLSGYHALSEHLPPSGPIFRKQMGSKAIPLPLQTAESGTLRSHLHTVALPETSHPWQGAHSARTHISTQGANLAWFTCFISHTCLNASSLSVLWGRMGDSVLCPPPQRGWICPLSYCLPGYGRRRQCKKNDPNRCLTVKYIGYETIV